jgi:hypothetical protein
VSTEFLPRAEKELKHTRATDGRPPFFTLSTRLRGGEGRDEVWVVYPVKAWMPV